MEDSHTLSRTGSGYVRTVAGTSKTCITLPLLTSEALWSWRPPWIQSAPRTSTQWVGEAALAYPYFRSHSLEAGPAARWPGSRRLWLHDALSAEHRRARGAARARGRQGGENNQWQPGRGARHSADTRAQWQHRAPPSPLNTPHHHHPLPDNGNEPPALAYALLAGLRLRRVGSQPPPQRPGRPGASGFPVPCGHLVSCRTGTSRPPLLRRNARSYRASHGRPSSRSDSRPTRCTWPGPLCYRRAAGMFTSARSQSRSLDSDFQWSPGLRRRAHGPSARPGAFRFQAGNARRPLGEAPGPR